MTNDRKVYQLIQVFKNGETRWVTNLVGTEWAKMTLASYAIEDKKYNEAVGIDHYYAIAVQNGVEDIHLSDCEEELNVVIARNR